MIINQSTIRKANRGAYWFFKKSQLWMRVLALLNNWPGSVWHVAHIFPLLYSWFIINATLFSEKILLLFTENKHYHRHGNISFYRDSWEHSNHSTVDMTQINEITHRKLTIVCITQLIQSLIYIELNHSIRKSTLKTNQF